jgi:hypothetical protein
VAQVVEHLLHKHEALRSNPSTTKKKKITSDLASGRRRIQARCKDLVKVIIKYYERNTLSTG